MAVLAKTGNNLPEKRNRRCRVNKTISELEKNGAKLREILKDCEATAATE
jgi:hypothetical protein